MPLDAQDRERLEHAADTAATAAMNALPDDLFFDTDVITVEDREGLAVRLSDVITATFDPPVEPAAASDGLTPRIRTTLGWMLAEAFETSAGRDLYGEEAQAELDSKEEVLDWARGVLAPQDVLRLEGTMPDAAERVRIAAQTVEMARTLDITRLAAYAVAQGNIYDGLDQALTSARGNADLSARLGSLEEVASGLLTQAQAALYDALSAAGLIEEPDAAMTNLAYRLTAGQVATADMRRFRDLLEQHDMATALADLHIQRD